MEIKRTYEELENKVKELEKESIERKKAEEINKTLFNISNAVNSSLTLDELYKSIHNALSAIIDVSNFSIAIYDKKRDIINYTYFVDEKDKAEDLNNLVIPNASESGALTAAVIKKGEPYFFNKKEQSEYLKAVNQKAIGSLSELWLGVPLKIKNIVIGAMIVQSYDDPDLYNERDAEILVSVTDQIALAIDRKRGEEALKRSEAQIKNLKKQTEEFSLAAASMISMNDDKKIFNKISQAIIRHSDFNCLIISYFKDDSSYRKLIGHGGIDAEVIKKAKNMKVPKSYYLRIFETAINIGKLSCYLPHTMKWILGEKFPIFSKDPDPHSEDLWHPEDMLFVKMIDKNGKLIGVISVDSAKSQKKPTEETVRPLEIFSSLISQIIIHRKIEEELHKAKIEAENANRSKSQFLANVSHEIRTPLNGIIGFSEIISNSGQKSEERKYAKQIIDEANKLMNIVNQLLDLTKAESGKIIIDAHTFNFNELLSGIFSTTAVLCSKKDIDFKSNINSEIPKNLVGDSMRIRQILINLLGNAIKFTDKGSVILNASIKEETDNELIILFEIIDSGIGIPKEKQVKIFESFEQADISTARKYGGSGIGTTISKELVTLMGGEICLQSDIGKGSTFWFTSKFQVNKKENKPVISETRDTGSLYKNIKDAQVLLVEDYPTNREIALHHLNSAGCIVTIAENGKSAIEKYKQMPFDLILMDILMPEMDGYEAAKEIRTMTGSANIPILAMTANAFESDQKECLNSGMDDVLTKPLRRKKFLSKVNEWLNQK